jgi:hypothetical protein
VERRADKQQLRVVRLARLPAKFVGPEEDTVRVVDQHRRAVLAQQTGGLAGELAIGNPGCNLLRPGKSEVQAVRIHLPVRGRSGCGCEDGRSLGDRPQCKRTGRQRRSFDKSTAIDGLDRHRNLLLGKSNYAVVKPSHSIAAWLSRFSRACAASPVVSTAALEPVE